MVTIELFKKHTKIGIIGGMRYERTINRKNG